MIATLLALAACGDDTSAAGSGGGGTGGGGTGGETSAPAAPVAVSASSSVTATTTTGGPTPASASASSSSGAGTGGGEGICTPVDPDDLPEFVPTAESIEFEALGPLPAGEQILFNDWNTTPQRVLSMLPDGTGEVEVFAAYGIWAMAVSPDEGTIAFSSGDPLQEEHYGLTLGSAIQHTFLYDVATETATNLTLGNVNDECHEFSPDGASLFLCRRYDTRCLDDGSGWVNEGYRVGRVTLATGDFEFLTPDDDASFDLHFQPDATGAAGVMAHFEVEGTAWSVRSLDVATGASEEVIADAAFPVISPDRTRVLYASYENQGELWSANLDGSDPRRVVAKQTSTARWSPDGTRVAFLVDDDDISCQHVEIANADGTQAETPTRIRDCTEAGDFITELAWITR